MARVGTVGELQRGELRKVDFADGSPEGDEAELSQLLDEVIAAHQVAFNRLVDVKMKHTTSMSPQSRAAAEVSGRGAANDESKLRDLKFEIEKRLATIRREKAASMAKRRYSSARRDLETLRSHMRAVNSGQVTLDERNRGRLGHAITVAEMRVAESA